MVISKEGIIPRDREYSLHSDMTGGKKMDPEKTTADSIDAYISKFPSDIQTILLTLRKVIKETVPEATEKISYQMPSFFLNGVLVYFAAFKNHIGFYPTASGITAFQEELAEYKIGRGSVQFPITKPLPYDLIRRIVKFKVEENMTIAEEKSRKK